jgi:aspartate/methionine/tyrosine aminotransferase
MRPAKSYIAKRFQNSDAGLSLDTDALARYSDIIDLSIGDTDFITDDAIIDTAFREAKAGYTHYGDPKGDPELIRSVCDAWQTDFKQPLPGSRSGHRFQQHGNGAGDAVRSGPR